MGGHPGVWGIGKRASPASSSVTLSDALCPLKGPDAEAGHMVHTRPRGLTGASGSRRPRSPRPRSILRAFSDPLAKKWAPGPGAAKVPGREAGLFLTLFVSFAVPRVRRAVR